jgi:hypothetical protein
MLTALHAGKGRAGHRRDQYGLAELSEPGSDRLIVGVRHNLKESQGLLPAVTGGRDIADG